MGKLKYNIIIGQRFGLLTIIEQISPIENSRGVKHRSVKAKCDCGKIIKNQFDSIRRQTSCGCLRLKHLIDNPPKRTHALTKHPLYRRWQDIKRRTAEYPCPSVAKGKSYKHYSGKGIRMCKEWENDFMSFYNWSIGNGYSKKLWIDRKKNNKGYSPENCRWVTVAESNRNTSKNIMVGKLCLKDYCEDKRLPYTTVFARLKYYGYSLKEAISLPKNGGR